MRPAADRPTEHGKPVLLKRAVELNMQLKKLSVKRIAGLMTVSNKLATKTHEQIGQWTDDTDKQRPAIDSFLGDIYSGLQVQGWSDQDRHYANEHLRILSGLYGILRPLDGIYPYRFEMGYKPPMAEHKNMLQFWGDSIARTLPDDQPVINLAAVEYSQVVTPYVDPDRIITPIFLTVSPKTGEPTFVVVHAKIARGAFARWLIVNRVEDLSQLKNYDDLNYAYDAVTSTPNAPVYICKQFGGLGLSVRLK